MWRGSLIFVALVAAMAFAAESFTGEAAVIAAARTRSNTAIAAHDAAAVVAFLEEDVRVIAGSGAAIDGKAAVRTTFETHFAQHPDLVYDRTPGIIELSSAAPTAAEHGTWVGHWTEAGKAIGIRGYYMAMWRKTGAMWLIRSELFVTLERWESPVPATKRETSAPPGVQPQ